MPKKREMPNDGRMTIDTSAGTEKSRVSFPPDDKPGDRPGREREAFAKISRTTDLEHDTPYRPHGPARNRLKSRTTYGNDRRDWVCTLHLVFSFARYTSSVERGRSYRIIVCSARRIAPRRRDASGVPTVVAVSPGTISGPRRATGAYSSCVFRVCLRWLGSHGGYARTGAPVTAPWRYPGGPRRRTIDS